MSSVLNCEPHNMTSPHISQQQRDLTMQKVLARGADNRERTLALVRVDGETAYVCPVERFVASDEAACLEYAVGFPRRDVRPIDESIRKDKSGSSAG